MVTFRLQEKGGNNVSHVSSPLPKPVPIFPFSSILLEVFFSLKTTFSSQKPSKAFILPIHEDVKKTKTTFLKMIH